MAEQLSFIHQGVAHRIVCGRDSIASLRDEVEGLGAKRAMVMCGPSILKHSDVVGRVQKALGDKYVGIFSGAQPHVPLDTVAPAVESARELKADVFISVGGGSTHDTTRCTVILLAEGGNLRDHGIRVEPPNKRITPKLSRPKLPVIAVSTTFGAAEYGGSGGFADKELGRYVQVNDSKTAPKVKIIDGLALTTTPLDILLSTGLGQLRVAIESIYSREHNPISDALCLHGIRLLKRLLPLCGDRDVEMLLHAKVAAGLPAIAKVQKGLNTAMAHQIGGIYNVDHGIANAIPLPYTMRFNLEASAPQQALIAEALGVKVSGLSDAEAGLAAADEVAALTKSLGVATRLRDVGIAEHSLEAIAKNTMLDKHIPTNPKRITSHQQILEVLQQAW